MNEQVPSKDQLRFSWSWDAIALNWRISMVDLGDGMLAGYDHLAGYYERRLIEEIERLRTALRGIQSCSTCEACRGAATRALGGAERTYPFKAIDCPHTEHTFQCNGCGLDVRNARLAHEPGDGQ